MAGNLLGARQKYVYKSDTGATYSWLTDTDLAVAGLGAADAAPAVFDPASPPANYVGRFPRGAEPRRVFVEDANGNRKALVAFDPTANFYATATPVNVTIDTVTFTSTGRKGEKFSF
jgi:hypothetical protein